MFFRVLLRTYLFLLLLCRDIIDYVKPVIVKEAKEKKNIHICVCVCCTYCVSKRGKTSRIGKQHHINLSANLLNHIMPS